MRHNLGPSERWSRHGIRGSPQTPPNEDGGQRQKRVDRLAASQRASLPAQQSRRGSMASCRWPANEVPARSTLQPSEVGGIGGTSAEEIAASHLRRCLRGRPKITQRSLKHDLMLCVPTTYRARRREAPFSTMTSIHRAGLAVPGEGRPPDAFPSCTKQGETTLQLDRQAPPRRP